MNRGRFGRLMVLAAALSLSLSADWPQWRGPGRDNKSAEKGLLDRWPQDGPPEVWSVSGLGDGYSTVAVTDDRLYTTGVIDGEGFLIAVGKDGKLLGKASYGNDVARGGYRGTRSTPTVADGRVYVMSGYGVVTCFDQARGKQLWQVDTFKEFGGRQITWQVSESLLVDGDHVICTPGGPKALLVALDRKTGETVWKSSGIDSKSAYCSPIVVDHNGRRIILTMVETGAVGVDRRTGKLLWHHPHKNKHAVHAATPIYKDGKVFITSGYGLGSELLELSKDGSRVTRKWASKALDNHHGGVISLNGYIYGTNNRELVCLEFETGKVQWTERGVGKGSLTYADGMLYVYGERGMMGLVDPDPKGGRLVSSFQVTKGTNQHWAHPVVTGGRLYIRHGDVLMAFDVEADK